MGQIETNVTIEPHSSKSITGYRSGSGGTSSQIKSTCDISITAKDPFDFKVDWRTKNVKVKELRRTKSGRKYSWYTIKEIPYPFYEFELKTRTIKEWRLVLSAGTSVIHQLPSGTLVPNVLRQVELLRTKLRKYGPCRPAKIRAKQAIMHNCIAWESTNDKLVVNGYVQGSPLSLYQPKVTNDRMRYRFFEPSHIGDQYAGEHGVEVDPTWNSMFDTGAFKQPVNVISENISTITAMLWPDSDDFEKIEAKPLVDISEAISDGVFPLGPPPNAKEAFDRMNKHALSDGLLESMRDAIDFGANSWLWATLVLEPVISSAVGLAASVEANDKAIDAYQQAADSNNWIQGKRLRIYGADPQDAARKCGAPTHLEFHSVYGANAGTGDLTHEFIYDKFEGNAHFAYKLSKFDASVVSSSGQQLGQYFQRLSSGLDEVLYNIIPLSFVYGWFSKSYSGLLDLKNKVYMPVSDWKVVVSHNVDCTIDTVAVDTQNFHKKSRWYVQGWMYWPTGSPPTIQYVTRRTRLNPDVTYSGIGSTAADGPTKWVNYTKTWYEQYFLENEALLSLAKFSERHKYYKRWVYTRPARRTDFTNYEVMPCLDTSVSHPLDDVGKQVTLGALLWGAYRS